MDNPRYTHTHTHTHTHNLSLLCSLSNIEKKNSRCESQLSSKSEASRDVEQSIRVEQEDDFVHLLLSSIRNI